jgi:5-methyltetrahydrofolate--homocysteine methyltransferase
MQTIIKSAKTTVTIGPDLPTALIGERINPTGRKSLAAKFIEGDLSTVAEEAQKQIAAGADIIDVNVGAAGVDQVDLLPKAVNLVIEAVDAPVSIDSPSPDAIRAALESLPGGHKPVVNSVNGEERALEAILPLVAEYNTVVVGLCMDDDGIPKTSEARFAVAEKIVERAGKLGIDPENILIDCLALSVGSNNDAGQIALGAMKLVRERLGCNMTLGASNVSFGLPDREIVNQIFLGMVLQAGVNCPIVNAAKVGKAARAADLLLGRDEYGMRYITYHREHEEA